MDILFVAFTALTVSMDSFVAGFSLSLNKRKSLGLPLIVATVTFVLCLTFGILGTLLFDVLQHYVKHVGVTILLMLGIFSLFEKDSPQLAKPSAAKNVAIGFGVGLDGAVATLSLVLQKAGAPLAVSAIMAVTHFATVYLGQLLASPTAPKNANVFSALLFFTLAAIKIFQ